MKDCPSTIRAEEAGTGSTKETALDMFYVRERGEGRRRGKGREGREREMKRREGGREGGEGGKGKGRM